ncbi:MAG: Adenylate cyclase [Xanthomonadaceae bacterium]|nr:Adenylate cyclase [Xanthomonadaceae bacterium]
MRDWAEALKNTLDELRRRRVFRVAVVFLVVGWVAIQVAGATFAPLGLPDWSLKLVIVLVALSFVLACALAWTYDITSRGIERTAPATAATAAAPEASVAILPFTDLSEAHDQDYFCDGLAEEILNALAGISGMRVASRTSSFRFRGTDTDARDIGRALNVASIMEGSVRKSGERVRVTAQLIDAGNGYHLWSENFDRRLEDIFAIQEEIARSVAQALRVSLQKPDVLDLERNAPSNVRAYEFYLRGRQIQAMKSTNNWQSAPEMFRRAIELDPAYAQAHAGLADSLTGLLLWRLVRPEDVLDEASAAAKRALELAPDLAEAHVAHANTLSLAGSDDEATAAFERAIALNSELYEAHYYFARHCYAHGQFRRAVDEFEAAHRTRPDEFQALTLGMNAADALGNEQDSASMARRALKLALAEAELDPENGRARYLAAGLQARLGDPEGGQRNIDVALRLQPEDFGTLYNAACFYAQIGDANRALELLDRAVDTGQGFRDWIEHDHDFDAIRTMPRFREIMSRLDSSSSHP